MCVYLEHCTAGEPGAVAGISGCWRVEGRLQGAWSPFSCLGFACASRHEGSMNGFCLASWCGSGCTMYEYVRVVSICKITFKRCLFCATKLRITERATHQSSTNFVELANKGHGKHRASREAGDGAHCGREGGKLYPDRIGCEMVARGAGGVRG